MNSNLVRTTGALLVVQGLLLLVPIAILGSAINWPASLSEPPAVVLPLIAEQASAVRAGYFVYLIFSVLFWPVALLTARVAAGSDELPPLLRIAVGFGIASAVARTLGIIRWLVAMPGLARIYNDPTTPESTRAAVEVTYRALNDYGGSIGEVLGVSLFAALWLVCLSVYALRHATLPRWSAIAGLFAAAALFGAIVELFGIDLGALITVTTSIFQLWMLALGVSLVLRGGKSQESGVRSQEFA
ncbi:DUF4386 domain-containing protein [Candidatus Gracilibacteria bacterium]|nr:DUF4386 domain-containing protein [Candidatus Gracilibacteria bacterium]